MLTFFSGSAHVVNSERAVETCLQEALAEGKAQQCKAIVFNTTLGHNLAKLGQALAQRVPGAAIFGASASGVTARDGVGEAMHDVAIMGMCGDDADFCSAAVSGIYGHNSHEKGLELAQALKAAAKGRVHTVYLLCPGIDIANDLVVKAFNETFGEDVVIGGGTASDNMRGLVDYQYHDGVMSEHDAWAIGITDPGIHSLTRATHGFLAYGEPMVVTKADGVRILELDGKPAWPAYTERLSLPSASRCGDTIPVGALAEELPPDVAREYGNAHILRVVTKFDDEGAMYYATTVKEGTKLWLTHRNEDLIFDETRRTMDTLTNWLGTGVPVAVFQTDCLARGRFLFNRIVKDELIGMIQGALSVKGVVPPWIGMYGFGEYARLGGKNAYHNYSTGLLVLYRDSV